MGFKQSVHEAAVYRRGSGRNVLLVSVYVDDLIITGAEEHKVEVFKVQMKKAFDMSDLSLLCFYLGVESAPGRQRDRPPPNPLRQAHHRARRHDRLQSGPHPDGGEAQAESGENGGGGRSNPLPAADQELVLPSPYSAGHHVRRQVRFMERPTMEHL
jgi:hypothetical protein